MAESFYEYELQKPKEEYKYRIGFWWGHEVETIWTDSQEEVLRIVAHGLENLYSITIHQQEYQGSPDKTDPPAESTSGLT